jgi:hypothetical protein
MVGMHHRLGVAGGAGGKGQERNVIAIGVGDKGWVGSMDSIGNFGGQQVVKCPRIERYRHLVSGDSQRDDLLKAWRLLGREHHLLRERRMHHRPGNLCLAHHLAQFFCTQQWHGGHRDHARLHQAQPDQGRLSTIGRMNQHATARGQPQVVSYQMGDLVCPFGRLGIREGCAAGCEALKERRLRTPVRSPFFKQKVGEIKGLRKLKLGAGPQDVWLFGEGRQSIMHKPVMLTHCDPPSQDYGQ